MHPSALKRASNSYPIVSLVAISLLLWPAPTVWGGKAKTSAGQPAPYLAADSGLTFREFQAEVKKFIGIPYRLGGFGPKGMDCSGFTRKVFLKLFGITLPHNSVQQSKLPYLVEVQSADLQTGDLLFFGPKKKRINHVGIYFGDGKFIHAGRRAGVTIADLNTNYWRSRFMVSKRAVGLRWVAQTEQSAKSGRSFDLWADTPQSFGTSVTEQVLELGTGKSLFSNALDVSLAVFMHASLSSETGFSGQAGLRHSSETPRTAAWQAENGFRASASLQPRDWLNVTPTLQYRDSWDRESDLKSAGFQIGLETWMASPSARWLLYLSGWTDSADNLRVLTDSLPNSWYALDISFGLGYRLTDSCRLSAMGTHLGERDTTSKGDPRRTSPALDSFAVKIDVNF